MYITECCAYSSKIILVWPKEHSVKEQNVKERRVKPQSSVRVIGLIDQKKKKSSDDRKSFSVVCKTNQKVYFLLSVYLNEWEKYN